MKCSNTGLNAGYLTPFCVQFPTIDTFINEYGMTCSLAAVRLERGLPATVEHGDLDPETYGKKSVRDVAEVTEALISLLDQSNFEGGRTVEDLNYYVEQSLNEKELNYIQ